MTMFLVYSVPAEYVSMPSLSEASMVIFEVNTVVSDVHPCMTMAYPKQDSPSEPS